jgi:DNA-directed RNA polymerase subunit RPC12/RpoP
LKRLLWLAGAEKPLSENLAQTCLADLVRQLALLVVRWIPVLRMDLHTKPPSSSVAPLTGVEVIMNPMWAVFAILAVSYYGTKLAKRGKVKFRPPVSRIDVPPLTMPFSIAFRLERMGRPTVRAFFLVILVIAAFKTQIPSAVFAPILAACGILMTLSAAITFAVDLTVRCKSCGKRMLLESVASPPFPVPRLQGEDLQQGRFQCMYCGQRYTIN